MHAIVPAEPRHAAAVASIYAPLVRDTAISFETEPPDAREMARRIESTLPRHPWLVHEEDGVARGYAYAGHHRARAAYRWSVEVSVYVAPQAHRSGVATGLYGASRCDSRRRAGSTPAPAARWPAPRSNPRQRHG